MSSEIHFDINIPLLSLYLIIVATKVIQIIVNAKQFEEKKHTEAKKTSCTIHVVNELDIENGLTLHPESRRCFNRYGDNILIFKRNKYERNRNSNFQASSVR